MINRIIENYISLVTYTVIIIASMLHLFRTESSISN